MGSDVCVFVSIFDGLLCFVGGAFIDCYPSTKHKEVLFNMAKNVNVARRFQEQRRDRENLLIVKFLESARSSYARKDLKQNYDRNRVAYRLFNTKTPHYALHLGLVKTAQDRIERRNKMAAQPCDDIAAELAKQAVAAGSTDDVTCLVLKLQ